VEGRNLPQSRGVAASTVHDKDGFNFIYVNVLNTGQEGDGVQTFRRSLALEFVGFSLGSELSGFSFEFGLALGSLLLVPEFSELLLLRSFIRVWGLLIDVIQSVTLLDAHLLLQTSLDLGGDVAVCR